MSDSDESSSSGSVELHQKGNNECGGQWGYIFSQVQNDLPAMETDSETNSSVDDPGGIFDRTLPDDKPTEETPSIKVFEEEVIKELRPQSGAAGMPKCLVTKRKVHTGPAPAHRSSSLLFQRLQKHLKENVNSELQDEELADHGKSSALVSEDIKELDSSICHQDVDKSIIESEGKKKLSICETTADVSVSSVMSEFEDVDVTTLLSLERLEEFDLTSILNDSPPVDLSETSAESVLEEKGTKEKSQVMKKLLDLCQKHERADDSIKDNKILKSGENELKSSDADHRGVGRTTVFIDLRPKETNAESEKAVESITEPIQRPETKSVGVSASDLPLASKRVQNMTRMHTIESDSESSDDDEHSQDWHHFRQRVKELSIVKSKSFTKNDADNHEIEETANSKIVNKTVHQSLHEASVKSQKDLTKHKQSLSSDQFACSESTADEASTTVTSKAINSHTASRSRTSATHTSKYYNLSEDSSIQVNGNYCHMKVNEKGNSSSSSSFGSSSYSATRLKENPSYSRLVSQGNRLDGLDSTSRTKKVKAKEKRLQALNLKKEEYYQALNGCNIRNETRYKLKVLLDKEKKHFPKETYLLFDMTSSFESDINSIPPTLKADVSQMVLLTINMLSVGQVVLHRSYGGHKALPVDPNMGFSVTYPLLLSWLLALVPEDLDDVRKSRTDDAFSRDLDPHDLLEDITGKEQTHVDVPFNVVSLNQYWQEDIQLLSLTAVIVPNDFYNPDSKRVRKKSKKEDAFLNVVRQFLQSNKIQDVCPWHERPESPLHYTLAETDVTCAMKPLSTYVAASNDPMVIRKALKSKPGFFSKLVSTDDNNIFEGSNSTSNSEITMCLLQKEAFMYPIAVFDIGIRLQTSCFDLVGLRLCYVSRRFIDESTSHYSFSQEVSYQEEIVPCALLAIKGRSAHKKWSKTVGPRDPVLARMSEKLSLNANYGEQLSNKIHSIDVNLFYHPRSETRAFQQICVWFGGRVKPSSGIVKNLMQANGDTEQNSVIHNGSHNATKDEKDDSVFKFETSKDSPILDEMKQDSYIVTSSVQRIYLVVSPQLPTRFISDVLCTVLHMGYHLIAVKRLRLDERKSAALNIPQRNFPYFCPCLDPDASLDFNYYEDVWLFRPSTVLLISKENGIVHQCGLIHALQTDLMVSLSSPEEGHVKQVTCQCFHTMSYSDTAEHTISVMNKATDMEVTGGFLEPYAKFYNIPTSPEMEQVVVFGVIGDEAIEEGVEILRSLAHGDFPYVEENIGVDVYNMEPGEDEYDIEPFNGFEVLGMKRMPSLSTNLANELCYFEVGTKEWSHNMLKLQNSPVLLVILRRVNAFQVLRRVLSSIKTSNYDSNERIQPQDFPFMMSSSAETAYRQVNAFFSDKELFPDNQSRPLLKYLPPPARLLQYRLHQKVKTGCTCGSTCVGNCQQHNGVSQPAENVKRSSSKKKKKNGKKDIVHKDVLHNGDGTISAKHLSSLDESIFSFMTTCNQPLTSIIVIKPDAFPRHFIKIMRELHRQDFTVVGMNLVKMSEHEAFQIAPSILKDMQGECQVYMDHMLSDLSLVACVQRTNAIRYLCELAGPHNPQMARSRCYSRQDYNSRNSRRRASLRALFGIDLISNGIHVSDSYAGACEEMKLFFPNGLCCKETQELAMECVPCPALDPYMCVEKMKGREVQVLACGRKTENGKRKLLNEDEFYEPLVAVLMPSLLQNGSSASSDSESGLVNGWKAPPYIAILDQLFNQGFEICAMRMAWCRRSQAEEILNILHVSVGQKAYIDQMITGPVLVLLMQRRNAILLFDSVLGRSKSNGDSLFYKYSDSILRSKSPEESKQAARYIFPHVPNIRSVLKVTHGRIGWNVTNGEELVE